MNTFTRWIAWSAGVILIAAGCGGDDGSGGPTEPVPSPGFDVDAATGWWVLTEADIDGSRLDLDDVTVTLHLSPDEIRGSGGCNSYGGEIDIAEDGAIMVGEIASTLMACMGPAGGIERAYFTALSSPTELRLEDDDQVLVLVSTGSMWTFGRDDDHDGAPDDDVDLLEGAWDAVELTTRGERIAIADADVEVTVEIAVDQIRGTAACNSYVGALESDRGRTFGTFVVTELSWTEMGCEPRVTEIEQAFLRALQDVDSYEVADGLYLSSPELGSSIRLVRQADADEVPFVGTDWELDTYIENETASNWAGMDEVNVRFDADGTFHGVTGCAVLAGTWRRTEPALELTELGRTEIAGLDCDEDDDELDTLVLDVLEGLDLAASVDGRRLTISARTEAGAIGLSFQVREPDAGIAVEVLDALAREYDLEPDGGVDGPVMYARRIDAADTMDAGIGGKLELDGDCLYVVAEEQRFPVLWPFGTRWDAAERAVVLPDGVTVAIAERFAGGGGYRSAISSFTVDDLVLERAARCALDPYREIAVLQSWR